MEVLHCQYIPTFRISEMHVYPLILNFMDVKKGGVEQKNIFSNLPLALSKNIANGFGFFCTGSEISNFCLLPAQ